MISGEKTKPFLIYLIGTSGSGKTTIGEKLDAELRRMGLNQIQFIDGDIIREELKGLFGYTHEERMKNNRVVCVVASYLLRNSISVILAQVGGYQAMRDQVRNVREGEYIEIYIKCSPEECERRDVKGYYKGIREGTISNINGKDDVFETPSKSDLVIDTEMLDEHESVCKIIELLRFKGYIR